MNKFQSNIKKYANKRKTVIYIAGKITGDYNYKDKFKKAEIYLRKLGFSVFNPANFPFGLKYESYLKICKSIIEEVDYIYVLKDFKDSEGAKIEIKHAERLSKRIIYQDAEDREFIESIVRI